MKDEKNLICNMSPRFLSLMLLEGDKDVLEFVQRDHSREKLLKVVKEGVERIETTYGEKVDRLLPIRSTVLFPGR